MLRVSKLPYRGNFNRYLQRKYCNGELTLNMAKLFSLSGLGLKFDEYGYVHIMKISLKFDQVCN